MDDNHDAKVERLDVVQNTSGDTPMTIIGLLQRAVKEAPDAPALVDPDRPSLTFAYWLRLTEETVKRLYNAGFRKGDLIAVALPTSSEGAAAYGAVMSAFAAVTLSPDLNVDEYERIAKQSGARGFLVQVGRASAAVDAATRLGLPVVELAPVPDGPVGMFTLPAAETNTPVDVEAEFAGPDDLCLLTPTSGTTDVPKLVPWTGKEVAVFLAAMSRGVDPSVAVYVAPLYHASGSWAVLFSIAAKSGMAWMPTFRPSEFYRYLAHYRPQYFFALPSMLQALVDEAPQHAAELQKLTVKAIMVGSAPLALNLLRSVQDLFGARVELTYAMTEVSIASTVQNGGSSSYREGSVGKVLPMTEVLITDEDGKSLPTGQGGEICVKAPFMFQGYWNNPEANAAAFRDGWFRTGDMGYVDADGFVYVTGRIKEVINRGGSKVSPLDVEQVLVQHPAVVEAAVFGFPHAALGEDVAAAVVLRDRGVSERELRRWAAQHLPLQRVPSRFVVVEQIPKTAIGKPQRTALAERFRGMLQR